ncbi:MAG: response regulator transcription factor [Desulfobacterales bacterium]|nr:response regulator transcription factor [Desulfobacterales bacterium]
MEKPRILVVDDHQIVRDSIGHTLESSSEFHVVARADNGRVALKLTEELRPDIVLMDVSMPDMNGIEATRQIVATVPDTKVMALTMHSAKPYVMGMLNAGASGYLLKTAPFEEVVKALNVILSGATYLSPEITHMVVEFAKNREWDAVDSLSLLSAREREVLQLISEGHTSKTISAQMNISSKTVDVHRNNIKKKLNIHTIAGLTKYAITKGLTDLASVQ